MGAQFETATFPDMSEAELKKAFARKQDELRAERGSGRYQGHLGLKDGLAIVRGRTFASLDEAEQEADDNDKSGPAVALRYEDGDGKARWLVAGWCRS